MQAFACHFSGGFGCIVCYGVGSSLPFVQFSLRFVFRSVINVLSAKTGELIGTFMEHKSLISTISIASTAKSVVVNIISASVDGSIFVWNLVSNFTWSLQLE